MTGEPIKKPGHDILLGVVTGAHGLKGEVKVKSFTHRADAIGAYGPVFLDDGRELLVRHARIVKDDALVVTFEKIATREAAESLRGKKIYIPRAKLPEPDDDEYYHADLVGLVVQDSEGNVLGSVRGLHNFGAGDVLEIEDSSGDVSFLPFTNESVPTVDIAGGRIVVNPPHEVQ